MKFIRYFFAKIATEEIQFDPIKVNRIECTCEKLPPDYKNYISSYLGQDSTNGRFADVTIQQCINCKRKWINYLVEFESFSNSGRFYKGIVAEEDLPKITPQNSIKYIERLDWYIYGGSYFETRGKYGFGKANVDL